MIKETMSKELKDRWIKALKSGKYQQGYGQLHDSGTYCCLGVLCKIIGITDESMHQHGYPSSLEQHLINDLPDWLNNPDNTRMVAELSQINDTMVEPFDKIADFIEENIIGV